jgi:hypothetical protein
VETESLEIQELGLNAAIIAGLKELRHPVGVPCSFRTRKAGADGNRVAGDKDLHRNAGQPLSNSDPAHKSATTTLLPRQFLKPA